MARDHYETLQQVFDDAYRGLHAQGFVRSGFGRDGSFTCRYRGPNEMRCAIGHCLTDEKYETWMEGSVVGSLVMDEIGVFDAAISPTALNELQGAHDGSPYPDEMHRALVEFVRLYRLTIPSVEEAA